MSDAVRLTIDEHGCSGRHDMTKHGGGTEIERSAWAYAGAKQRVRGALKKAIMTVNTA